MSYTPKIDHHDCCLNRAHGTEPCMAPLSDYRDFPCGLTKGHDGGHAPKAAPINNPADALIDAAAAARTLLGRLTSRLEITEELAAEISSAEDALWAALFPGAAPL